MAFFDWNHDGKKDIWDTLYEFESYRRFSKAWDEAHKQSTHIPSITHHNGWLDDSNESNDDDWRIFAEDGFEFGLDPEDYETEEEYEEALSDAKEEGAEEVTQTAVIHEKAVSPEDYPNKRRFKAALALAEDYFVFESYRESAQFVNDNADKILAANYLSYAHGFLFAQSIKDNFNIPCSLPDEDEEREMDFYAVLVKIAKKDISLTFKIWEWCLQQFGPYIQYDETAARQLSKDVFDNIYSFTKVDVFKHSLVRYMNENYMFCKNVMSLCDEFYYNLSELIAIAIKEKYYDTANILFRIELDKASCHWKEINNLTDEIIMFCCSGKDLVDIEYFRDYLFPAIRAISNGMVQDEIPEFERTMEDFIQDVEESNPAYAYSRRNAWRNTVPDGKKYGLKPIDYDSEAEYLEALEEEKHGWRKWYNKQNTYGLNPEDYETCDEFEDALFYKEEELREIEEQKKENKQREQEEKVRKAIAQKEKEWKEKLKREKEAILSDKTIYTYCSVSIPKVAHPLSFISEDASINIGDTVLIPFGPNNEEIEGTVVSVGQYTRVAVPYPVERTKKIIKKL